MRDMGSSTVDLLKPPLESLLLFYLTIFIWSMNFKQFASQNSYLFMTGWQVFNDKTKKQRVDGVCVQLHAWEEHSPVSTLMLLRAHSILGAVSSSIPALWEVPAGVLYTTVHCTLYTMLYTTYKLYDTTRETSNKSRTSGDLQKWRTGSEYTKVSYNFKTPFW